METNYNIKNEKRMEYYNLCDESDLAYDTRTLTYKSIMDSKKNTSKKTLVNIAKLEDMLLKQSNYSQYLDNYDSNLALSLAMHEIKNSNLINKNKYTKMIKNIPAINNI